MKISVIGDIIYDSLNEKELDIMRHFSRTELKAAINMLKEFTAKGNFAVLMYMGDTDKLGISVIGTASSHGTLEAIGKCRGDKKLLVKLQALLDDAGYEGGKLRICHVENEALADKIADMIKQAYGAEDVCVYKAGGLCSYYAERGGIILSCETK